LAQANTLQSLLVVGRGSRRAARGVWRAAPSVAAMSGVRAEEVRRFLASARPDWTPEEVSKVQAKLNRVDIDCLPSLLQILSMRGIHSLNSHLAARMEKGLSQETLNALRAQMDRPVSRPVARRGPVHRKEKYEQNYEQEAAGYFEADEAEIMRARMEALEAENARLLAAMQAPTPQVNQAHSPVMEPPMRPQRQAVSTQAVPKWGQKPAQLRAPPPPWACDGGGGGAGASGGGTGSSAVAGTTAGQVYSHAVRPPGADAAGDFECFEVVFPKVFVKQEPDKDAKGWCICSRGQKIQVRHERAADADGRLWVELTLFELWRLGDEYFRMQDLQISMAARAFALIDGTGIGLGILLRGPLPKSEWPVPDEAEAAAYVEWLNRPTTRRDESNEDEPQSSSEATSSHLPLAKSAEVLRAALMKEEDEDDTKIIEVTPEFVKRVSRRTLMRLQGLHPDIQGVFLDGMLDRLQHATAGTDIHELAHAIECVRPFDSWHEELRAAERRLDLLLEGEAEREKLRQRIANATSERELLACIGDCDRVGYHEESTQANQALDDLLTRRNRTKESHCGALDRLTTAVKAGDAGAIREAIKAAKAVGVPKREIARVHSLNCTPSAT